MKKVIEIKIFYSVGTQHMNYTGAIDFFASDHVHMIGYNEIINFLLLNFVLISRQIGVETFSIPLL